MKGSYRTPSRTRGWFNESRRHMLAAKGVSTGRKKRLYKFGSDAPANLYYFARKPRRFMQESEDTTLNVGQRNIDSDVPILLTYADEVRLRAGKDAKYLASKPSWRLQYEQLGGLGDGTQDWMFDRRQLRMGQKVEMEHTDDPKIAKEIARDHLSEDPKYYDHLEEMERKYQKPRRHMAYAPAYVAGDLPLIAADAVGTAGAAAIPLIPVAVAAGALYGGAKLAKSAYKKSKKYMVDKESLRENARYKMEVGQPLNADELNAFTEYPFPGMHMLRFKKIDKNQYVMSGGPFDRGSDMSFDEALTDSKKHRKYQVIKKLPDQQKWRLYSTKTGKNLGTFPSKAKAMEHEHDIQFFKHSRYDPKLGKRVTVV